MARMDWGKLLSRERPRKSKRRVAGDLRSEFERDYGRAVFSAPVRRLQDKTQVFPLERHDYVRTRLTHSIEVSSFARNVTRQMAAWLVEKGWVKEGEAFSIETIAATVAFIHDLGNPPFGHAGEKAIQTWFNKNKENLGVFRGKMEESSQYAQDLLRFEGNAQTLRLVTKLQVMADLYGLNLTFATLSALCKYLARSDGTKKRKHSHSKPGFFASEAGEIKRIREATGTGESRNPITHLVEASDDIIYSTGDVEDAVKKRILSFDSLVNRLKKTSDKAVLRKILDQTRLYVGSSAKDEERAQAFRNAVLSFASASVLKAYKERYDEIMDGAYDDKELLYDQKSDIASIIQGLKDAARAEVYVTDSVLKVELMGRTIIHGLMDLLWEAAQDIDAPAREFGGKMARLISSNYRQVYKRALGNGLPKRYCQLQLMTDQVSGMTDTFAVTLYNELKSA